MRAFKHYPLLAYLAQQKLTKKIIAALSAEVIKAICEVALNIKLENIQLSKDHSAFFTRHSREIRNLATKSVSLKQKRKILTPAFLKRILLPALDRLQHGHKNETSA